EVLVDLPGEQAHRVVAGGAYDDVPGDVFVGEAVRFARRHQVVAPHEEYVGIAPGLHLTRDDEGHLHVVRVGAAQRHGVADLPAILVHEDFADDGGALFFAGRLALLLGQRIIGKHFGYLRAGADAEHRLADVAPRREPSGDRGARCNAGHLVDIVAVARGEVLPRRGLVVDNQAKSAGSVLDDAIHRGRYRDQDGVDEGGERDGEDGQNSAAQIPAHVALDQFDPVEHDDPRLDRAQRFDDSEARRAPRGQQSAERANRHRGDYPRYERAHRQPKPEDDLADVHELAAEPGRIRDQHAEYFAEHAAGEREHDAFDDETREHVEAAEAQHAQHAYFAGASRDRGVYRVHRTDHRADGENHRDDQAECAQLIDEPGLPRVKLLLGHRIDFDPRIGRERFGEIVMRAGLEHDVQHLEAVNDVDILGQDAEIGQHFGLARAVPIGKDADNFENVPSKFEIAADRKVGKTRGQL